MFSQRLRSLRVEKKLTKKDLAAILPLKYNTYANYESGFREPNMETLQLLARFFNVSLDYLASMTDNKKKADDIAYLNDEEHDFIDRYRLLDPHGKDLVDTVLTKEYSRAAFPNERPVIEHKQIINEQYVTLQVYYQSAPAGFGVYLGDESGNDYEYMRFASTPISMRADFCVIINDDSMEPKINESSIVFVKSMPKIEPDNVGIFTYNGETLCKRLRVNYKKNAIYLESFNKFYAPKHITRPELLRTVGLVIGIATPM